MPSRVFPMYPRLSDGVIRLLRDLIHERTGTFFDDQRLDLLVEKLEPITGGRPDFGFLEFYYRLKDGDRAEWTRVWEALTVQETYFWREMSQIDALAKIIVPAWFQRKTSELRVWSAACSSGEEPYSIAIALHEAGFGCHPIEIIGTDANISALQKAEKAVYRERSFRSLPPELRQKYFAPVAEGWKLSPVIAGRVKFHQINLSHPGEISPLARAQVIFCRNVFIYFSPHAIRQVVASFAAKMPPGGYLFTGAAESLLRMTADFELTEVGDALAYQRI